MYSRAADLPTDMGFKKTDIPTRLYILYEKVNEVETETVIDTTTIDTIGYEQMDIADI
jgi:hypothetical protein